MMKEIKARIPVGRTVYTRVVELFTVEEAKQLLSGKDWDVGEDIYSATERGKRIGWLAKFPNGEGIYVESK